MEFSRAGSRAKLIEAPSSKEGDWGSSVYEEFYSGFHIDELLPGPFLITLRRARMAKMKAGNCYLAFSRAGSRAKLNGAPLRKRGIGGVLCFGLVPVCGIPAET